MTYHPALLCGNLAHGMTSLLAEPRRVTKLDPNLKSASIQPALFQARGDDVVGSGRIFVRIIDVCDRGLELLRQEACVYSSKLSRHTCMVRSQYSLFLVRALVHTSLESPRGNYRIFVSLALFPPLYFLLWLW